MELAADRPHGWLTVLRSRPAAALALVVLLVLVISSVLLGVKLQNAAADDARDEAVLAAARQEVLNFTTLHHDHLDRDFNRIIGGATGQFEKEFSARTSQLDELLQENRTVSEGDVVEAGIVSADDDSAKVIVVADAVVRNTEQPQGTSRHYRMKLSLVRTGERWLTSQVEFVG